MEIIILIICLLISIYGFYIYRESKDIFNPVSMFIWPITTGYIIFLAIYYDDSIKNETLIIYLIGILSFIAGFFIHRNIIKYPMSYSKSVCRKNLVINKNVFFVLKIIAIIGIIATVLYVVRTAYLGPYGSNIIRNLRYMGNYENTRSGISTYGIVVVKFILYIITYQTFVLSIKQNKKWIPLLVIGVIFGFMATIARTEFIEVIVALYYLYSVKYKVFFKHLSIYQRLKQMWKAIVVVVFVSFIFIYIAEKTEKIGSGNFFDTEFFFFRYAGLELKNFDSYILGKSFSTLGYYSFGIIGKILNIFGLGPNNDLFIMIADRYNGPVCSFIAAPYADFGIVGVIVTMVIQGIFHSYVYMKSIRNGGYWIILYTTCIYSDLMAFYSFQYLMSSQFYVIVLIIIVHLHLKGTSITYVKSK